MKIVDILILADIHKATELKSQAIQFLLRHREEVFANSDWKNKLHHHPGLVTEVLESTVDVKECPPPSKRKRRSKQT